MGGSGSRDRPATKLDEEQTERLRSLHNRARQECSSKLEALHWDEDLADYASSYAAKLAGAGKLSHSLGGHDSYKDKEAGENLAVSGGQPPPTDAAAALQAVNGWAGEGKTAPPAPNHYTAMMWDGVDKIGCGQARGGDSVYTVCNYRGDTLADAPNMNYESPGHRVPCDEPISVEGFSIGGRVGPSSEAYARWQ